jgi:serine phosphatase RsbU (regulator of sigma subunit)/pSer/pThr/pTyr-binding forkhead associated (FHA) protein
VASLQIVSGLNAGQVYALHDREVIVGRDVTCSIVLPYRTVSRAHARILRMPDGYWIEDLQSVNGTAVNGKRIERRTRLVHRDRVRIHDIVLAFVDEEQQDDSTVMVRVRPLSKADKADAAVAVAPPPSPVSTMEVKPAADRIVTSIDARSGAELRFEINAHAKLKAVLEITQSLGSTLDTDAVLPRILESLFRIFPQTDRGYILQVDPSTGDLTPKAIKHRAGESDTISPISGTVAARVMSERAAFLSGDAVNDERLEEMNHSIFEQQVRSVMCAPLMGSSQTPVGVVHVETSDARHTFSQQDLDVLVSVGYLAGQAVESARTHGLLLELDRQKRDLAMAREVQMHFLPDRRPELGGYKFFDFYRPADQVAGDYFDYIELPHGRLALVVGDVAGKGVTAALLMARLCSDVRYALLTSPNPAEALRRLNEQICSHRGDGTFVTMVVCLLDPLEHTLTVVNAGHAPPLLRRGNGRLVESIDPDSAGLPLGVNRAAHYDQSSLALEPGDLVVCFTDGVNEAMNPQDQTYGLAAVREVIVRAPVDCVHVGNALVADVRSFSEGRLQSDDICLLCFGRCE